MLINMVKWNSNQYLKFKNERIQPAIDLVNRLFNRLETKECI